MENSKNNKYKRRKVFKSRKQRRLEELNRKDDRDTKPKQSYEDIVRKNESFEFYYKQQNIVDNESEWNEFLKILSEPLPSAFRISSFCKGQAQRMIDIIQNDYINCINVTDLGDDTKNLNILPILWYPNKLAWTINLSKIQIRKSPALRKLHNFLISETEIGGISRQEAVSMIPPVLLDIKSGQNVLDMCAAPGSKTAQIIEFLHQESNCTFSVDDQKERKFLDGLVVANEVDNRRCYMLIHQSNRLHSPCVVIINHDASTLPNFYRNDSEKGKTILKFDRVLADVPCSGDGTVRKNYDVWTKWNVGNSNNYHYLQLKIAKRGLELLAKDGIMAYSTCSLNPIENEAVVATLLNMSKGELELINASELIPELKCREGLEKWIVMTRDNEIVSSADQVPHHLQSNIRPSVFPPSNASELNLKYCIRIMPHYQNTGGFFIALIRKKVDKLCWENTIDTNQINNNNNDDDNDPNKHQNLKPKRKRFIGHNEDPFFLLDKDDEDFIALKSYYQLPDYFPPEQLSHRCRKGKRRNLYYLTEKAANFIKNNPHIRLISGGSRVFNRVDVKNFECPYRITQEGIPSLFPYFMQNIENYSPLNAANKDKKNYLNVIEFNFKYFILLLKNEDIKLDCVESDLLEITDKLASGCCILYVKLNNSTDKSKFLLPICAWKGKNSIRAYVNKNERNHLLRLCNEEPLPSKDDSIILSDDEEMQSKSVN